jgi:uncharacterized protein YgbK (DUF1537 family)
LILAAVADDFSGANDSAGRFASAGLKSFSSTALFIPQKAYEALILNCQSRFLNPAKAQAASRRAWWRLLAQAEPKACFQKLDSTLRGQPGAEVLGLLESFKGARLAFCVAYPRHGRVTRGGKVYVHGKPLLSTEYARDPLSPARIAQPHRLFAKGIAVSLGRGNVAALRKAIQSNQSKILCFDAVYENDLDAIVKACLAEGIRLFAGASGLGGALASRLSLRPAHALPKLPSRRAILAGSVSKTTLAQLALLPKAGFDRRVLGGLSQAVPKGNFALSSVERRASIRRLRSRLAQKRFADSRMRALVREGLRLSDSPSRWAWFLTGGHTAEVFFDILDLKGMEVYGEWRPGLPLGRAVGQHRKDFWVLTKPGGFGGSRLMAEFLRPNL